MVGASECVEQVGEIVAPEIADRRRDRRVIEFADQPADVRASLTVAWESLA